MAFSSVLVRAIQTTTRSLSVAPLRYQLRHVATKPSLLDNMEPKSFARRDKLREIEADVQTTWQAAKIYETNAPTSHVVGAAEKSKYMCTFPYPYMNGKLHLGHAFTVLKADFAAGYQRLLGKNVLFPFGFHCTGMPIQAAANKIKRELETGSYLKKEEPPVEEEKPEVSTSAPSAGGAGTEDAKVVDPTKFHGKKSKAVAKTASGSTQYEIMLKNGIPEEEIAKFKEPSYWLEYFPPIGKDHLTGLGCHIDWRRSFITTDANPFYDSFIRWQFNRLKKLDKLGFGKRPTIYSPTDGQACADHDRASGEGVNPVEYTLIKLRILDIPASHHAADRLKPLSDLMAAGKRVYFVAATLRPETMYGQTNCFLLPEGEYGAFEINDTDVFIAAERAARNMSYQGLSKVHGVHVSLGSFTGDDLLALPIEPPYATYRKVYTLPLLTISMAKGTGVVTSVPSDAPDDYAALRDLKEKPKLREKYHITDEMVNFDVVEIIDIPGFGRQAAVKLVTDLKIKSQNDTKALKEAKDQVYMQGFHNGVMIIGKYAGKRVCDAKPLVRADMLAEGHAAMYWEPESEVISRSGDVCVVAELDQWYLKYGEEDWRTAVEAWVKSPAFKTYTSATLASFEAVLSWLKEWACSRNFGLGTKLPWDPQFVIESLSDSTIYMSYYTIAHLLQGGEIDPHKSGNPGPLGIRPEQMTEAVWDHIFVDGPFPADAGIPKEHLDLMKREFDYWYPMDLRVSGKDLINNHLTMALYNHAAIWGARPDRMPQSFFCNGHILIDGEKMSKQKNFITLEDALARWGADATRFALADAGDGLDDANFEKAKADIAILKLTTEEEYVRDMLDQISKGTLRTGEKEFADLVFETRMTKTVAAAKAAYDSMRFRDALQFAFYQLQKDRDTYRDYCGKLERPVHADTIRKFFQIQYVVLAPICPHFCEFVWGKLLHNEGSVTSAPWPADTFVDEKLLEKDEYMSSLLHVFRTQVQRVLTVKVGKGKPLPKVTRATIYVASSYSPWQHKVLEVLRPLYAPGSSETGFPTDALSKVQQAFLAEASLKPLLKKAMEFGSKIIMAHQGSSSPLPQLDGRPPLNEHDVWTANIEYVRRALDIEHVQVVNIEEPGAIDSDPSKRAKDVLVGEPVITPLESVTGPVYA